MSSFLLSIGAGASSAQSPATQPAASAQPARSYSSQLALQQKLREFRVDGIPFEEVLSLLSKSSGANFGVRWNQLELAGVDRQALVSVDLRSVTLAKALSVVLESVEPADVTLGYYVHENVITITLSHAPRTNLITRVYDVTDMMYRIPDIQPGGSGGGSTGTSGTGGSNSGGGNQRNSSGGGNSSRPRG